MAAQLPPPSDPNRDFWPVVRLVSDTVGAIFWIALIGFGFLVWLYGLFV